MPVIYRKLAGRDVWHFHENCRHVRDLAGKSYSSRGIKPRSGELCNECQAKARADKRLAKRKRRKS